MDTIEQRESILLISGIRELARAPLSPSKVSRQVFVYQLSWEPAGGCLPADRCVYLSPVVELHDQIKDDQIQQAHQQWHRQHGLETSLVMFWKRICFNNTDPPALVWKCPLKKGQECF